MSADALAVICFESEEASEPQVGNAHAPVAAKTVRSRSSGAGGLARRAYAPSGEFTGKLYEHAMLHRPQGIAAKRLVVIGGGKRASFQTSKLRRIAGVLVRLLKGRGVRTIALLLDKAAGENEVVAAVRRSAARRLGSR